jgi:hypothetical protein
MACGLSFMCCVCVCVCVLLQTVPPSAVVTAVASLASAKESGGGRRTSGRRGKHRGPQPKKGRGVTGVAQSPPCLNRTLNLRVFRVRLDVM